MDNIKGKLIEKHDKHKDTKWHRFIVLLYKKVVDHNLVDSAAMLTYFFILSFFPFIIFLISLISYTPLNNMDVLQKIIEVFPLEISSEIAKTITDIVSTRNEALLSTSIIFATYTASKGLSGLIKAINTAYNNKDDRSFLNRFGLSIVFTISLAVLVVIILIMLVFGKVILIDLFSFLNININNINFLHVMRVLIPALFMFLVLVLLYRFAPSKRVSFKSTLVGALSATVLGVIASLGFGFYVNNYANYNLTYGSLGGIIVFLIWIDLLFMVIVLGAEINATLIEMKK